MTTSGKDLIAAGAVPGKWFPEALRLINEEGLSIGEAISRCEPPPVLPLSPSDSKPIFENIRSENDAEAANVNAVKLTMQEVMRTPVTVAGSIMPDACPAGPIGTIPVGGIVSSSEIHPGMHSADICCSMAITIFDASADPKELLDAVQAATHFGPGGRPFGSHVLMGGEFPGITDSTNPFLQEAKKLASSHFATQGDGNHFAYVGRMKSDGKVALVTHHGSRGPGAMLYKAGMRVAEKNTRDVSPETLKQNAWINADSREGELYWDALQHIRRWTKASHFRIHGDAAHLYRMNVNASSFRSLTINDQFWNEHNFVFRKSDGLFYHAKGATPAFKGWADDAGDRTIIPLNMGEPILIVRGRDAPHSLGFSPHGAGRNFSRTQHKRQMEGRTDAEIFAEETAHIDARFFMGITDISELPSAYKNAAAVREQISEFGLADIVDEVIPYGCIMAGDWERDAPWKKTRKGGDA
jgi:hypothetical protein